MLEKAGVQLTEYEQFLANLKEELPIIGVGAVCDKTETGILWTIFRRNTRPF